MFNVTGSRVLRLYLRGIWSSQGAPRAAGFERESGRESRRGRVESCGFRASWYFLMAYKNGLRYNEYGTGTGAVLFAVWTSLFGLFFSPITL
jgi:hypothetical protein